MKKFSLIVLLAALMLTGIVYAEDMTESQNELYGYFRLDYDLSKTDVDNQNYGGFNNARARLGWNFMFSDVLKSSLELDIQDMLSTTSIPPTVVTNIKFAIRKMLISWSVMPMLNLTAGKIGWVYTPELLTGYDKFYYGIDVGISTGDMVKINLQFGNEQDTYRANDKTYLALMPAVTVNVADQLIALSGKVDIPTPQVTGTNEMVAGLGLTVKNKLAGLSTITEFAWDNITDSAADVMNLGVLLDYKINDYITPEVTAYAYNLNDSGSTYMNVSIGPMITPVKSLLIYPFVEIKNIMQDPITWSFTFRFQWKPKAVF
ncbi:MAG: hypothetical protein JW969_04845 [Spirochaetales bacterium]|nr:hypothetical protein [Spirochaetales bacterium]